MSIIITTHALVRRYQKFNSLYKKLDRIKLIDDITEDFNISKKIGYNKEASFLFKSDSAIYVVMYEGDTPVIITTYPAKSLFRNYDISVLENVRVIYKCDISTEIRNQIEPVIKIEDYLIFKHDGRKKLIWVNGFLLYCSRDNDREIIYYTLHNIWSFDDLKNDEVQFNIRKTHFQSDFKWNEFLKDIKMFEYVYDIKKKEHFPLEILIYQQVLNNEIPKFPLGFWQEDIGGNLKIAAQLCTRYMIEDVLHWTVYEICNLLNKKTFKENKLGGMLDILFTGSIFEALDNAYPNKYPIGMIKHANTISYWEKENNGIGHAKKALSWVIEDCKKDGLIINKNVILNYKWDVILKKYNLSRILSITFKNNYREFIENGFDVKLTDEEYERFSNLSDRKNQFIKNHF